MSLQKQLKEYSTTVYPMHMPGHKGGRYRLIDDLYEMDLTEVDDTDHLYMAEGILKESLERIRSFYHTKESVYLVNGSTVGLLSALYGLHKHGDAILVARNCHQSVYHGLELKNLTPYYIMPKKTEDGLIGGIDTADVELMLTKHPEIVSFVMTSPTYEGFISDIEGIAKVCHQQGVCLIVDEAHGAHLDYTHQLPKSALQCGADVVVHSLHKTLPVFTGCGLLHLNISEDLRSNVMKALQRFQTSSPSYVMMAQMDACVQTLGHNEALWTNFLNRITSLNEKLETMHNLKHLSRCPANGVNGILDKDPLKSVIVTNHKNVSGHDVASALRTNHGFQMELSSAIHTLGIITVADTDDVLIDYEDALISVDKTIEDKSHEKTTQDFSVYLLEKEMGLTPYEVIDKVTLVLPIKEAIGYSVATMITPYPPGIPLLVAGERLTEEVSHYLLSALKENVDIIGVNDGLITVINDSVV